MEAKERELLESLMISNYKDGYYSGAKLNIDGYVVEIKTEYFDTLDEAVSSIKERITKAVLKFKPE